MIPTPPQNVETHLWLVWAAVALLAVILPLVWKNRKDIKSVSNSVNHRHKERNPETGEWIMQPSLVQMVTELHEWKAKWDHLPADLRDDIALKDKFKAIQKALDQNNRDHAAIMKRLNILEEEAPGGS